MKNRYTETICNALEQNKAALKKQFQESISECGVRFCFLDGLLPEESALEIYHAFPAADRMRFMHSTKEQKYTSKDSMYFVLTVSGCTSKDATSGTFTVQFTKCTCRTFISLLIACSAARATGSMTVVIRN